MGGCLPPVGSCATLTTQQSEQRGSVTRLAAHPLSLPLFSGGSSCQAHFVRAFQMETIQCATVQVILLLLLSQSKFTKVIIESFLSLESANFVCWNQFIKKPANAVRISYHLGEPAERQHSSIVIVSMLAYLQPHKDTNMAVDST